MNDLIYGLRKLCDRNADGSFATRANRQGMLTMMGTQLREMGYHHMHVETKTRGCIACQMEYGRCRSWHS